MKELIYIIDRVIRTGCIHVYGVGITSSTHRLAAFLPLTCTSWVGREPYIPTTGEGWKGV
ncbi:UNVERIFIED_CONTAM: hypothetical protein Slati_4604800 [Sesamum latifolium]|uniref:Uncharacterized protein n=1 Tax=Sesamum latifolium TaxID=2727402 RepID=A0AAW2S1W7_9LAMI